MVSGMLGGDVSGSWHWCGGKLSWGEKHMMLGWGVPDVGA